MHSSTNDNPVLDGEDYYQKNYPNYRKQNPDRKLRFYLRLVQKHVASGNRIFELGVGLGLFAEFSQKDFEYSGSDVNPFGVFQTQKRIPAAADRIQIGSYEVLENSLPPQAVVSWDVLEHIPELSKALLRIHSSLPAGGVLIGVVPVYDGPLGFLVHLLDRDPTHLTKVSRASWHKMLNTAGFEVVEWGGILRILLKFYYVHFTRPQWLLRRIGSALYFVAKKC